MGEALTTGVIEVSQTDIGKDGTRRRKETRDVQITEEAAEQKCSAMLGALVQLY